LQTLLNDSGLFERTLYHEIRGIEIFLVLNSERLTGELRNDVQLT